MCGHGQRNREIEQSTGYRPGTGSESTTLNANITFSTRSDTNRDLVAQLHRARCASRRIWVLDSSLTEVDLPDYSSKASLRMGRAVVLFVRHVFSLRTWLCSCKLLRMGRAEAQVHAVTFTIITLHERSETLAELIQSADTVNLALTRVRNVQGKPTCVSFFIFVAQ